MKTSLDWADVLLPLPLGVLFGVLTILGWIHGWEGTVALTLIVTGALAVAWRRRDRRWLHGFLGGFLAGLVAVELQALFISAYFRNNPGYSQIEIPFGMDPQLFTFIFAPINAVVAGLLLGTVAWGAGLMMKRRG